MTLDEKRLPSVRLTGDSIRITIPVDYVRFSTERDGEWRVTDGAGFAAEVVRELVWEQEDGTTPVHEMLDRCIDSAADNGAEHIEEVNEDVP